VFWFWFFVGPALALAVLSLRGERKRAQFVDEKISASVETLPPAAIIVPVEGPDGALREKIAALAAQDYPDYELILTANTASDIPPGVLPRRAIVVLSGATEQTGRIDRLLAGIRVTRKRTEVFAFAGAEGLVSKVWLRSLVSPLVSESIGASTGFRWYMPEPPSFWSLMRSVWNAPIAGLLGPGDNTFVWTGALAMRKQTFFVLRLHDIWKTSTAPDAEVAAAARQAGLKVVFAPGALVAIPERTRAGEFFRQARHEMAMARRGYPRLWWSALLAHIFYCGAMVASIIASVRGSRGAEWALVVLLGIGMLKGANRATLAKAVLREREAWFERHAWVHSLWVPLATWIWLWVLLSSAFTAGPQKRAARRNLTHPTRARA
jgi:hypothetical protein